MQKTNCDVLVLGGGIEACLLALASARSGARTILVERRAYLGHEVTATMRPWVLRNDGCSELPPELSAVLLPDEERDEIDIDGAALPETFRGEICLFRGSTKKGLMSLLTEAGVEVLLMCDSPGLLLYEGRVAGALIAGKWGLFLLQAGMTVDTSGVSRRAGVIPAQTGLSGDACSYTIAFSGVEFPPRNELTVPTELGISADTVRLHAGRNSACSLYVEFEFVPSDRNPLREAGFSNALTEACARDIAVALATHLTGNVPEFERAVLAELALETAPPRSTGEEITPPDLSPGLLVFPGILGAEISCHSLAQASVHAAQAGVQAAAGVLPISPLRSCVVRTGGQEIPLAEQKIVPYIDPHSSIPLYSLMLSDPSLLPCLGSAGVLVAGGGTAGANAAIAAAIDGADVLVVDANSDLGGTQTLGLVSGYYHGYKQGWTERLDENVAVLSRRVHAGRTGNRRVMKTLEYARLLSASGGRFLGNTVICGGIREGSRVSGILVSTDAGLARLEGDVLVDATGDGDMAKFCGLDHTFGNPRDGNVQDYSQWSMGNGGWQTKSPDLDVIDQRLISEMQRGLRVAHMRGRYFDFSSMLTVREGRHIIGETTVTMRSVFEGDHLDDAIAVALSDWDPHGTAASWLGRLGFLPLQTCSLPVAIPIGSCIPADVVGLVVSAKAISATVDAACLCRMAADIQNLGYATGLLAARAVACAGDPRGVDVPALQGALRSLEIIPSTPLFFPRRGTAEERVSRLATGDEDALLDVLLLPEVDALPLLRQHLAQSGACRIQLGKGLAWFNDASCAGELVEELSRLVRDEEPPYCDDHPHKEGKPRAGIVDVLDDYWRINQLLVLLGKVCCEDVVPVVCELVERQDAGGPPIRTPNAYISGRIDMQRVPHYDRLLCIAFAVERLATPELGAALETLLAREFIGGHVARDDGSAGREYHLAYAELHLLAAGARCGSRQCVEGLITFLSDTHAIHSSFALAELRGISGIPGEECTEFWHGWLTKAWLGNPVPLGVSEPSF